MRRPLKYIAFAGTSVLSCTLLYKTRGDSKIGTLYAAAEGTFAEVLRSGPAHEIRQWNRNWDFREPTYETLPRSPDQVPSLAERFGEMEQKPPASSRTRATATRHLLFIRHGQYVKAEEDEKRVLTQMGRQQAEATAGRLKMLHLNNHKIDKIIISTMIRAKETGEIICKSLPNVPHEYCDFLREGAPCMPEPRSSSWRPEHHEIFQESARIEAAFRKHIHRAEPEQKTDSIEVYVCHANVIRYFVCRSLQFPTEGWLRMSIGNCGITWLTIKPSGNVVLRSMGDTGHLHPDLMTRN